jgi:hypothetical protein
MKNYQFKMKMMATIGMALMMVVGVGTGEAAYVVESFEYFMPSWEPGSNSRYMHMDYGDNLMIRDSDTGIDSVVAKTGVWHLGLYEEVSGVLEFGAFANTDNAYSDTFSGYEGWLNGYAYDSVFSTGESPDGALLVFDPDGGRMALYYASGAVVFDANVTLYWADDIEFDGVLGDIDSIVFSFAPGADVRIPSMVVVPEPATMAILAFGGLAMLRRRK